MSVQNGVSADQLRLTGRKSRWSNLRGTGVQVAALPDGKIAVRNSRHPSGPALIYTRAEIAAFLAGADASEFDGLA